MPIDCEASEGPGFLRFTVTGEWPGIGDLSRLRSELIASGHLTSATRALFDVTNVENVPNYRDAGDIVATAMKEGGLPLHRAYLVASAVQYGFVRQLQTLAPPSVKLEIFFNETEAMLWLGAKP